MAERPILFSGPLVRAILDGRKTQTRRVVKPQPPTVESVHDRCGVGFSIRQFRSAPPIPGENLNSFAPCGPVQVVRELLGSEPSWRCPYGVPGDRLWVRETFRFPRGIENSPRTTLNELSPKAIGEMALEADYETPWCPTRYEADGYATGDYDPVLWCEWGRLRPSIHMPRWASRITLEVTEVRVERVQDISEGDARAEGVDVLAPTWSSEHQIGWAEGHCRDVFRNLWNEINGPRGFGWNANPWTWAISFRRVE